MIGLEVDNRFSPALRRFADRLLDTGAVFRVIDGQVIVNTQHQLQRFTNRARWTPLRTRYAEYKRREVGDRPTLIFRGTLAMLYGRGGRINADNYEFGPDDEIVRLHHHGDAARNIPARPLSYDFAAQVAREALVARLRELIDKSGL